MIIARRNFIYLYTAARTRRCRSDHVVVYVVCLGVWGVCKELVYVLVIGSFLS